MHDIFISYSQADRPFVARLAAALELQGWSVWWDSEIRAGTTYDQVIEDALAGSRCAIVVWSTTSVKSGWVRAEAEAALDRRILVPVQMEQTVIPLIFRRIHYADLVGWDGDAAAPAFQRLAQDVGTVLGTSPVTRPLDPRASKAPIHPPALATTVAPPGGASRRWLVGAAIAAALFIAAFAVGALIVGLNSGGNGSGGPVARGASQPQPGPVPEPQQEPKPDSGAPRGPDRPVDRPAPLPFQTFREDREGVEVTVPGNWSESRKEGVVTFGFAEPVDGDTPSCRLQVRLIPRMSGRLADDTRTFLDAFLRNNDDATVVRRSRTSIDRYTALETTLAGSKDGREQHATFYTIGRDTGRDFEMLLFAQTSDADEREVCDPIFDRIRARLKIR